MFANAINAVSHATLGDLLDVLLIAFLLYTLFLVIKDTKAYQMAIGLGIFFLLFLMTQWGRLVVSNRILRSSFNYIIIAVIVLFQGEIRRFFTSIGSRSIRSPFALRGFQEKIEDL
ncbi:MAG TPA: TIGR00159 family protein, partial [Candidatus Aminicenantes bacterium]|nr:TIGR00159 family protein [Candidatus Aminicenantes bacterium]